MGFTLWIGEDEAIVGILQETAVRLTQRQVDDLVTAADATNASRQQWRPLETGRNVLDLILECGAVNARWAEILMARRWVEWPVERVLERHNSLKTLKAACEQLRKDTEVYIAAVRDIRDEELERTITLPWGERKLGDCLFHAASHMSYHEGQISYIQTLYGDWTRY